MTIPFRLLKRAFIPAQPDPSQGQMPGPDGKPVGPGAGAPPAGPGAGAPPADPTAMAGGPPPAPPGPPADPSAAGGPPPSDPSDPGAGAPIDPNTGAPPVPQTPPDMLDQTGPDGSPIDPNAAVNHGQARVVMDIVERTLTAVGKNKKNQPPAAAGAGAGGAPAGAPDPTAQPGPITGQPGDMSSIAQGGPIKMGAASQVLARLLA